MSESQLNAWYAKVDTIRRGLMRPAPKRLFLPAARIVVAMAEAI